MISRSSLRIAWRNLGRSRRRTALAIAAVAIGQLALLASSSLMHGYADNIRQAITGPMIGHAQVHAPDWREERALDLTIADVPAAVAAIEADPAVAEAAPRLYAPVLVAPVEEAYQALTIGVDVARESGDFGLLTGFDEELQPRHVLLGYRLARRMQAKPGMEIAIVGQAANGSLANDLYTVQAIVSSPADMVNQAGIVMPLAEAQALFALPGQAHEIVVRARRGDGVEALTGRLRDLPALAGLEVRSWRELAPELVVVLEMSNLVSYIVLVLVFVAAIAGITNTLMMATFERLHELGMLLALGTRPARLVAMIVAEAVLIGVVGVGVGTVLGIGFVLLASRSGIDLASWGGAEVRDLAYKGLNLPLHIYPRLELGDVLLGLGAIVLTALIASAWPAWHASRLEPVEAMRA